jgi:hypothetical protein
MSPPSNERSLVAFIADLDWLPFPLPPGDWGESANTGPASNAANPKQTNRLRARKLNTEDIAHLVLVPS